MTVSNLYAGDKSRGRRQPPVELGNLESKPGTHIDGFVGQDILGEFSAVRIDYRNRVLSESSERASRENCGQVG